jgi:hypothetical protein
MTAVSNRGQRLVRYPLCRLLVVLVVVFWVEVVEEVVVKE